MEISTFQDAGPNLNRAMTWHTVNSALIMNYDELNRFTGSLNYSIRRFIFLPWPKGGPWHNASLNTLLSPGRRNLANKRAKLQTITRLLPYTHRQERYNYSITI